MFALVYVLLWPQRTVARGLVWFFLHEHTKYTIISAVCPANSMVFILPCIAPLIRFPLFPLLLILSLFLAISWWCWVCCHGDTHLSTVWVCDVLLMRQCDCVPETSILPAKQHTHTHTHTHTLSHAHIVFAGHAEQLTPVTSAGLRTYTHTYMLSHCLSLKCWTAHTYTRQRAGNAHTHTHTHTDWLINLN